MNGRAISASGYPGRSSSSFRGNDHLPWEGDQRSALFRDRSFRQWFARRDRIRSRARDAALHGHRRVDRDGGQARGRAMERAACATQRDCASAARTFWGREIDATGDGMLANLRRSGSCCALRRRDRAVRPRDRPRGADRRSHRRDSADRFGCGGHSRPHRSPGHGGSLAKRSPRLEHGEGHRCGVGYRVRGARRTRAEGRPGQGSPVRGDAMIRYSDDWLLRSSPTKCSRSRGTWRHPPRARNWLGLVGSCWQFESGDALCSCHAEARRSASCNVHACTLAFRSPDPGLTRARALASALVLQPSPYLRSRRKRC